MSPTLVLDPGGRPYAALGAAGATRIITALAQVLTNLIDYGMTVEDALRVPRIHAQVSRGVPEGLILEEGTDEGTKEALRALGHELDLRPREDFVFGAVQAIRLRPEDPDGGADPRRLGATAKPD
jgi:gamma-glutamyltranspeptidase/glutathione hydrolase